MKFLTSLVSNSRQSARRPVFPGSVPQPAAFSPSNPIQEGLPMQPDTQPSQTRQRLQQNDISSRRVPPATPPQEEPKTGSETGMASTGNTSESHRPQDAPAMPEALHSQQPSSESPEPHSSSTHPEVIQSGTAEVQLAGEAIPQAEGKPASPAGQAGIEPRSAAAHETVAGQPGDPKPRVLQVPGQTEAAAAIPPHSTVDSATAETGMPGLPADPSAEPTHAQEHPLPATEVRRQEAVREQSSDGPQNRQPAEDDFRPVQASAQLETAVLSKPVPRQPFQQNQTQEIPQVRIGQINVLVEDQAPAKPKSRKSAPQPAAANPFGLRGL
ncbi:MAG: hypothetical protein ABFS39_03740 [Pseudomonadota bacterium]